MACKFSCWSLLKIPMKTNLLWMLIIINTGNCTHRRFDCITLAIHISITYSRNVYFKVYLVGIIEDHLTVHTDFPLYVISFLKSCVVTYSQWLSWKVKLSYLTSFLDLVSTSFAILSDIQNLMTLQFSFLGYGNVEVCTTPASWAVDLKDCSCLFPSYLIRISRLHFLKLTAWLSGVIDHTVFTEVWLEECVCVCVCVIVYIVYCVG